MAGDYANWAKEDIKRLESVFTGMKAGSGDADQAAQEIFQISHDIKGQGGSFDYPLMTIIGGQLCAFIDKRTKAVDAGAIEVIGLHINAMQLVIAQALTGDGGAIGNQLLDGPKKSSKSAADPSAGFGGPSRLVRTGRWLCRSHGPLDAIGKPQFHRNHLLISAA